MAMGSDREGNCIFGHPKGCKAHTPDLVKGKPFKAIEHKEELVDLGLTVRRPELAADAKTGKKPPGQPKKVGSVLVYPARHFA